MKKERQTYRKSIRRKGVSYQASDKQLVINSILFDRISVREASRRYGVNRRTIDSWLSAFKYSNVEKIQEDLHEMGTTNETDKDQLKLLKKQVLELSKALEKERVKVKTLETLIEVGEETFKIKIRKKSGAKRSIK